MKKKKKIGLKDIASRAEVSIATVSYVLSNGKNNRVSAKMAEKIKAIAKDLNYRPNQIAQSLKSGKTKTIGLIVADISNPFFSHIARIIEDVASQYDYTVIFGSSDERPEKTMRLLEFLADRQVDGFILAPTGGHTEQVSFLKERDIPFVLIDRHFPDLETDYVVIDNFKASYRAIERLIKTGNRRIGMIAYGTELYHMRERVRGYTEALKDYDIEREVDWLKIVDVTRIEEDVPPIIEKMFSGDNTIEALFFATNTLAIAGLKRLGSLNVKIPSDLRIVSFDEGEAFDFFYCPLTYLRQPLDAMGRNAVEILVEKISTPEVPKRKVILEAELRIRQSCALETEKNVVRRP